MTYVLDPYLPAAQVHVLAGSSGTGKTTLLLQALADPRPTWGRVLYVAVDRRIESIQKTQSLLGLRLPHVKFFSHIDELVSRMSRISAQGGNTLNLAASESSGTLFSLHYVDVLLTKHPADTVIIDPAPPLLPIKSFNDMGQVSRAMSYVAAWAQIHACTVILVFHTNKTKRDSDYLNIMNRISGSHALLGYASTKGLLVSSDEYEDGPALILQGQHFADRVFQLERLPGSPAFATSDFSDVALPEGAFAPSEAALLNSVSRRTITRRLEQLVRSGTLAKVGYGKYQRA